MQDPLLYIYIYGIIWLIYIYIWIISNLISGMHIQEFSHSGLRKLQIAQAVALPVWTTSTLNRLRQGKCSPLESLKQPLLMDEKGGLVLTDHSPTNGWLIWSYPNKPISSTNGSLIYDTNLSTNLKNRNIYSPANDSFAAGDLLCHVKGSRVCPTVLHLGSWNHVIFLHPFCVGPIWVDMWAYLRGIYLKKWQHTTVTKLVSN